MTCVNQGTHKIHRDRFSYRRIKRPCPAWTSSPAQLKDGGKASGGEGDVEEDPEPVHIGAIERRMPGQDNAPYTESGGGSNIDPATDRFAVESSVFSGHDGSSDEKRDAGVVDASKAFHEGLL